MAPHSSSSSSVSFRLLLDDNDDDTDAPPPNNNNNNNNNNWTSPLTLVDQAWLQSYNNNNNNNNSDQVPSVQSTTQRCDDDPSVTTKTSSSSSSLLRRTEDRPVLVTHRHHHHHHHPTGTTTAAAPLDSSIRVQQQQQDDDVDVDEFDPSTILHNHDNVMMVVPFLSLPVSCCWRPTVTLLHPDNDDDDNEDDDFHTRTATIPSPVVGAPRVVPTTTTTRGPRCGTTTTGMASTNVIIATSTTTTMIPLYIYIIQHDENDDHTDNDDDDDDDDMVYWDATEIITYPCSLHPTDASFGSPSQHQMYTLLMEYYYQHQHQHSYSNHHSTTNDRPPPPVSMIQDQIRHWIHTRPTLAQIQFRLPVPLWNHHHRHHNNTVTTASDNPTTVIHTGTFRLLTYFVLLNWYEGVQMAYQAYPEAIGQYHRGSSSSSSDEEEDVDPLGGCLPLHYACFNMYHGNNNNNNNDDDDNHHCYNQEKTRILTFLLQCYPDGIRKKSVTTVLPTIAAPLEESQHGEESPRPSPPSPQRQRKQQQRQQLPIHILCQYCRGRLPLPILQLLWQYFPLSLQIHDGYHGYTPLQYLCANSNVTNMVELVSWMCHGNNEDLHHHFGPTMTLRSIATNDDAMEYVLHLASRHHADCPELIQFFLDLDPRLCQYTNAKFQLPIHTAVLAFCQYAIIDINHDTATEEIACRMDRMMQTIQLLADAYPASLQWRDDDQDETPGMMVTRCFDTAADHPEGLQPYREQLLNVLLHS